MYPPETAVAEKLETIVSLGMANSRLRDYYDLITIFRLYELGDAVPARAIVATFERRRARVPEQVPTGLSSEYGSDPAARRRWTGFVRRLRIVDAPADLAHVVERIRDRVWPVMQRARTGG